MNTAAAADDAAGVAIASRLTSEIRGTNQAIRNAMDGQAMLDTAEGAHQEIEFILQRMRELAVQSANDTNDASDRAALQLEVNSLTSEINRIAQTTSWAGQKLLDGTGGNNGGFTFQVGSRTAEQDRITTSISAVKASNLGLAAPDPATDIVVTTGGSMSTAGVLTMNTNLTANVQIGGRDYTLDFATSDLTGVSASATGQLTVINTTQAISFKLNGIEIAHPADAANTTTVLAAADVLAAFNTARTANMATLGHLSAAVGATAGTNDHIIYFTSTAANKATAMETILEADAAFNNDFVISANAGGAMTFAAKSSVVSTSVAAAVTYGTGAGGTITAASNVLSVTADPGTAATAANYSTRDLTINGSVVRFNSYEDGTAKGFDITNEDGFAAAIKAKLENSGLGLTVTQAGTGAATTLTITKSGAVSVASASSARSSIEKIDAAVSTVNAQRASLGAVSNRLDSTVRNLTNISTNLEAGRGRIEDADFAAETTSLAKSQILSQASMAMLAQANASKQGVLSLLQR